MRPLGQPLFKHYTRPDYRPALQDYRNSMQVGWRLSVLTALQDSLATFKASESTFFRALIQGVRS